MGAHVGDHQGEPVVGALGLAIDGRFGFTAIGRTVDEAAALEEAMRAVMESIVLAPGR